MRIMDCVLLLFGRKVDPVVFDPERKCVKPSWGESLKVTNCHFHTRKHANTFNSDIELTNIKGVCLGRAFISRKALNIVPN